MQITISSTSEFSKPFIMPKFQNSYGNKPGAYDSWGDKLTTNSSYDPKKDFYNTGQNFINSLTLSTGNKYNQTFASVATTNAKGIVPNKEGGWIFFDYVPGDADIREGSAAYTGLITVIGVKVDIEQIKDIFGVK